MKTVINKHRANQLVMQGMKKTINVGQKFKARQQTCRNEPPLIFKDHKIQWIKSWLIKIFHTLSASPTAAATCGFLQLIDVVFNYKDVLHGATTLVTSIV